MQCQVEEERKMLYATVEQLEAQLQAQQRHTEALEARVPLDPLDSPGPPGQVRLQHAARRHC